MEGTYLPWVGGGRNIFAEVVTVLAWQSWNVFTRGEVDRMPEPGIFDGRRFELIDGELFDKTGQNPPHAYAVRAVNAWLNAIYPRNTVLVQLPIEAGTDDRDTSLPEPDLAVIAEDKSEYKTHHARGDEVLLVIEVADTSLRQHMLRKRDLYARAGVAEYWVVDLDNRRIIVHRSREAGQWREVFAVAGTDMIAPASRPEQAVTVDSLLP